MRAGHGAGLILGVSACAIAVLGLVARAVPAEVSYRTNPPPPAVGPLEHTVQEMSTEDQLLVTSRAVGATARVSARTCSGHLLGSGFLIEDMLITNRHMVDGATLAKVELGQRTVLSPVLAVSDSADLAFVGWSVGDSATAERLELAHENPPIGAPIILAGHAGGGATEVIMSRVHTYSAGHSYGVEGDILLIDARTEGGFSGGPVLDNDGDVVAVLQGFDRVTGLTLAIPVETIAGWLADATETRQVQEYGPTEGNKPRVCP